MSCNAVDPNPHGFEFELDALDTDQIYNGKRIRIRIQEHGNLPKFKNKPGFLPFKRAVVPS
jgi:hypothetical protein